MAESRYRTLIIGKLEQVSALCVGGAGEMPHDENLCHRDGLGRLTIPGTSLAGALIETAARMVPEILHETTPKAGSPEAQSIGWKVTGKLRSGPPRRATKNAQDLADFLESVWYFRHAHPESEEVLTEWRQGVGIRQATGATARQKRALYDFEVVPAGTRWRFLLEIDTCRGGAEAEALAVLALDEWRRGLGWLGRGAARGTGWIHLLEPRLLRLPVTREILERWPDATKEEHTALESLRVHGAEDIAWGDALSEARALFSAVLATDWLYLRIHVALEPGLRADGYGVDLLQVGGHPSLLFGDPPSSLELPWSLRSTAGHASTDGRQSTEAQNVRAAPPSATLSRGGLQQEVSQPRLTGCVYDPDTPFVSTHLTGEIEGEPTPFLPGSGLRGPLRHVVSRLERARQLAATEKHCVLDPNAPGNRGSGRRNPSNAGGGSDHEESRSAHLDPVARWFGLEERAARILISDAIPLGGKFALLQTEHHAEDEFAGGVFGSSKFNRIMLSGGRFEFQVVVELPGKACSASGARHTTEDREHDPACSLQSVCQLLGPALELAQLSYVPVGGSKWRGAGWVPWRVERIELLAAGQSGPLACDTDCNRPIPDRLARIMEAAKRHLCPGGSVKGRTN